MRVFCQIAQSHISIYTDPMDFPSQKINHFLPMELIISSELIGHSQECGLCYQNIKPSLGGGPHPSAALCSSNLVKRFMNQSLSEKLEARISPHVAASDDTVFDGYRRVQVIITSISSIQTDSVSDIPYEAFPKFVALFRTATKGQLLYLTDMRELGTRICDYLNRQGNIPQLSFAGIKRWHKQMAEEQSILQQAVAQLVHRICKDERSTMLIKHIFQSIEMSILGRSFLD